MQATRRHTKLAGLFHHGHLAGILEGDQLLVGPRQGCDTMPQSHDPAINLNRGIFGGTGKPLEHLIGKNSDFVATQITAQGKRLKVGGAECPGIEIRAGAEFITFFPQDHAGRLHHILHLLQSMGNQRGHIGNNSRPQSGDFSSDIDLQVGRNWGWTWKGIKQRLRSEYRKTAQTGPKIAGLSQMARTTTPRLNLRKTSDTPTLAEFQVFANGAEQASHSWISTGGFSGFLWADGR